MTQPKHLFLLFLVLFMASTTHVMGQHQLNISSIKDAEAMYTLNQDGEAGKITATREDKALQFTLIIFHIKDDKQVEIGKMVFKNDDKNELSKNINVLQNKCKCDELLLKFKAEGIKFVNDQGEKLDQLEIKLSEAAEDDQEQEVLEAPAEENTLSFDISEDKKINFKSVNAPKHIKFSISNTGLKGTFTLSNASNDPPTEFKTIPLDGAGTKEEILTVKPLFASCNCELIHIDFEDNSWNFINENGDVQQSVPLTPPTAEDKENQAESKLEGPLFIPTVKGKEPLKFDLNANENSSKYLVTLDMSHGISEAGYYKLKSKKKKGSGTNYFYKKRKWIAPRNNAMLSFSIFDPNSQYDSISASHHFTQGNLEGRTNFENVITSITPSLEGDSTPDKEGEPKEGKENPDVAGGQSGTVEKLSEEEKLKILEKELNEYNIYLSKWEVSRSVYQIDLSYIDRNIKKHLNIEYSNINEFTEALDSLKDIPNDLKQQVVDSYKNVLTYNVYSLIPIQIKDYDALCIDLDFHNREDGKQSRSYKFLVHGGFKVDFSTGLAYSNLRNENYQIVNAGTRSDTTFYVDPWFNTTDSITAINDVQQKEIQKLQSDNNIGVTALAHFYPRTGGYLNLSATVGFSLNTNANINYLAGGSIILGEKMRFIITGGLALGQVDKLNPKYSTSEVYDDTDLSNINDNDLTYRAWEDSWFIGVSWNFGPVNNKIKEDDN